MTAALVLRMLRQEDCEFKVSIDCLIRLHLQGKTNLSMQIGQWKNSKFRINCFYVSLFEEAEDETNKVETIYS